LTPHIVGRVVGNDVSSQAGKMECKTCQSACVNVAIPYVFCYLVNELASMNIKISLDIK